MLDRVAEARECLDRAEARTSNGALLGECERLGHLAGARGFVAALLEVERELRGGDTKKALRLARRQVRRARNAAESWLVLGIVRQKLGQSRRAERALRRAIALSPGLGEAHDRLGILLVSRGALDEGRGHLERAIALSPADPAPRLHLAQTAVLLGRADEGARHLEEARRLGANSETIEAVRRAFFSAGS
ncbi:MAG: hypothetical protein Fur0037_24590 [Planctomycetota bacterium]